MASCKSALNPRWFFSTDRSKAVIPVLIVLWCFVVYSARRFVVCLTLCHFVLVFFSPFSIAITSLGEGRASLSAFHMFHRVVLVWICRFPLPLNVREGLRFVIVALPGLFSYLFFFSWANISQLQAIHRRYFTKSLHLTLPLFFFFFFFFFLFVFSCKKIFFLFLLVDFFIIDVS